MKIECKTMYPYTKYNYHRDAREPGGYRYTTTITDAWNPNGYEMMFCNCCGASYAETTTEKTRMYAGRGIKVFAGHVGSGKSTKKTQYEHIMTKAGPLTIAARIAP